MAALARGAAELGLDLTQRQLEQFEVFYRELADWNQRMNLTSIVEYEEVQVKHFLDSLTACLALPGGLPPGTRVIDVGAGAGLPGIPLKLLFPEIHLILVESVGKKTTFMRHLATALGLTEVEVHTARAEELGQQPEFRGNFDLALARGLAKLPALVEYTLPLCRLGGKVIAWKHGGIDQEIASAARALTVLGGKLSPVVPVNITGLMDNRILVVIEKVRPTPAAYPRRPGMPAKQPL
ncbi:MAG: 16S rRNA (guanine(527)-N(7))-methyltransferase RsmG [SAR202 cluster bacterium]|nr:16S rRNA (guanine(527)-N(7))-methyltransferase RsmG [SAR202 cluster bacterium]